VPKILFAPSKKQFEAYTFLTDNQTSFVGYGGSAFSGKSYLMCYWLTIMSLGFPGTGWGLGRRELTTLKKTTLITLFKVFAESDIKPDRDFIYNQQYNIITFANGSQIFLIDTDFKPSDPLFTRFGGLELTGAGIDESSETTETAIQVLSTRIGRRLNDKYNLTAKILEAFNPDKGHIYARYYKPWKDKTINQGHVFIKALPSDNPSPEVESYVRRILQTGEKSLIERLIYGNFEYEDDPLKLFSDYNKILDMFTNEFVRPGEKYLTADIAYEGSDVFVIGVWSGLILEKIVAIDKIDETLVSKKIHELRILHGVPLSNTIYDADGLKTFVRQSANSGNLNGAVQFHNNGTAFKKEHYYNLKAQCYFELADKVEKNQIYIRSKEYRKQIIEDLEQIKQKQRKDDTDPLRLEAKEDLKERLRRSPDFSDCFIAGTKILTPKGEVNIEELSVEDYVVTPFGNRKIINTIKRKTTHIHNINDKIFTTGNHRFVTERGLISADSIKQNDYICRLSLRDLWKWRVQILLNIMDGNTGFRKQILDTTTQTSTLMEKEEKLDYISKRLSTTTGQSRRDTTYTILTETLLTTLLVIWLRSKEAFIGALTNSVDLKTLFIKKRLSKGLKASITWLKNGISQKTEESGIVKTVRRTGSKECIQKKYVNIAKKSSKPHSRKGQSIARISAIKIIDTIKRRILRKERVKYALLPLRLDELKRLELVQKNVRSNCVNEIDVYTLTVENDNVYYANGFLVENCIMLRMYFEVAPRHRGIKVYN
jgi:phage terminase large subunit